MSAFLGPIHYWLYNKIQNQKIWVLAIDKEHIVQAKLEKQYGIVESCPLEEVIETGNIHGWLQGQVSSVEYYLAEVIKHYGMQSAEGMDKCIQYFRKEGVLAGEQSKSCEGADQLYKYINDTWLDGMPCDHANRVIEATEAKVVWVIESDTHKQYWEAVGIDIAHYYAVKKAWLQGFAEGAAMQLTVEGNMYTLERR